MSSKPIMESDEGVSNITKFGYEVFLSYWGPNTRHGFTNRLCTRLTDAGIRVFRYDEELRKGAKIESEPLKGIKESKIAIPIFSKGYAADKWCLKELAQIVKCKRSGGLKIMPIFYGVEPSEVHDQTGGYEKAFESHKEHYDENTINSWKAALREVGELRGWSFYESTRREEGRLLEEVTTSVLRELKKSCRIPTYYLVGVEHLLEEISRKISADTSDDVKILGICGIAGTGKTTLARIIYEKLLDKFDSCSFLANVRETYQYRGMGFLYKNLISDFLGEKSANISNVDEGIRIIKERFREKRVILVLDDVDESQLHLIEKLRWFCPRGRIIITTRNKGIFDALHVDWPYELSGLKAESSKADPALQLFSKHAFQKDHPPKKYLMNSKNAVDMTKRLPLALEVLGSLLYGRNESEWDSILRKLEPAKDVLQMLEIIILHGLDDEQKRIFLDIACFFIGKDYRLIIHFWEDPHKAMEVLQRRCLVKINGHEIWMPDVIRDLGEKIAQKQYRKYSIQWMSDEVTDLDEKIAQEEYGKYSIPWMSDKGNENVQAIRFNMGKRSGHHFTSDRFANVPNLRLLHLEYDSPHPYDPLIVAAKNFKVISKGCLCRRGDHPSMFSELRWLSLHWFLGMRMTKNITFQKLAILDLSHSGIKSSWSGWSHIKVAKNLKVLNLTGCWRLVKTPDFSCHLFLEQLILEDCWELVEIDKSISSLERLVILNLSGCRRLKKLPRVLGCVKSLEELNISFTSIIEIPSWRRMERLKVFNSFSCYDLKNVSSLDFAANITELSFASSKITVLPDSIGELVNLLKLSLKWCKGIKTFPESIGGLVSLVELNLQESGIVELPREIGMMENLTSINARNCSELHIIPVLPKSLISLEVSKAKIESIPDLSELEKLKKLEVQSCPNLVQITGFAHIPNVKIWNCEKLN